MLFESLSRQTSLDYELICIDDLGSGQRHAQASEYALRKGIPLAAILKSKPKVRGKRFGQCNAINSGEMLHLAASASRTGPPAKPTNVQITAVWFSPQIHAAKP